MKTTIKYIFVIFFALVILAAINQFAGNNSNVVVAVGKDYYQFRIAAVIFFLLVCCLALYLCLKFITASFSISKAVSNFFKGSNYKKQERLFYDALFELLLGNYQTAKASMEKLTLDAFHGFNYLTLAQLALQQNKFDVALMWLEKAKLNSDPRCINGAQILTAQAYIQQDKPEKASELLSQLDDNKNPNIVKMQAQALANNNEWQALEEKLPKWKKLLGDNYSLYHEHIATNKFAEIASKQGANQLKTHWDGLSRQQKNDESFRTAYLKQLVHQGMHNDSLAYLLNWYKKKPLPVALLDIIKPIKVTQPAAMIGLLETSIKAYPEEASYYATLGHISYRSGDSALGEKALIKAIELEETEAELLLLAELLESKGDYQQAMQAMRRVHALQRR